MSPAALLALLGLALTLLALMPHRPRRLRAPPALTRALRVVIQRVRALRRLAHLCPRSRLCAPARATAKPAAFLRSIDAAPSLASCGAVFARQRVHAAASRAPAPTRRRASHGLDAHAHSPTLQPRGSSP